MKHLFLSFLAILGMMNPASAQKVVYTQEVKVVDPSHKFLRYLSNHPELIIDHPDRIGYEVYGPNGLQAWLTKHNIQYVGVEKMSPRIFAEYPSPEQIIQKMQTIQQAYPQLVTLIEIGKSTEGRSLMVAKITAPANRGSQLNSRPEFKYVANMHGDEIAGRELMIRLIEDLAKGYGADQRITRILDSTQVYILPSMNPDGAFRRVRYNARNVDLNRAFPDFTTPDNVNDWRNRELEIQAVMKFQAQHQFKLSANFHGGAEVVNYPWDTEVQRFPLDNYIQQLSLAYSRQVPYLWNSTEFKNGIVNGYDWYEVNGGMQDWSYYWYRDIQVTIELTSQKWPPYSTIDGTYQLNRSALLGYIEAVHTVPSSVRQ